MIVIQQHPGAKITNQDREQVSLTLKEFGDKKGMPKIIVSDFSTDEAQVLADAACYYQTSMAAQFALAEIPTFQIGHEPYNDILIKNSYAPAITDAIQFVRQIEDLQKGIVKLPPRNLILKSLGIREDWVKGVIKIIQVAISSKKLNESPS